MTLPARRIVARDHAPSRMAINWSDRKTSSGGERSEIRSGKTERRPGMLPAHDRTEHTLPTITPKSTQLVIRVLFLNVHRHNGLGLSRERCAALADKKLQPVARRSSAAGLSSAAWWMSPSPQRECVSVGDYFTTRNDSHSLRRSGNDRPNLRIYRGRIRQSFSVHARRGRGMVLQPQCIRPSETVRLQFLVA